MTGRSGLAARRAGMGVLAVVVGVSGIVVGDLREDAGAAATAAAPPPRTAAWSSELRYLRRDALARTSMVDAAGTVRATFTDGARTVTLDGPLRRFAEPRFTTASVSTRVWVRLLPRPWHEGAQREAWFQPWLAENLNSTAPDVLAVAAEYLDGVPDGFDGGGVRVRGDARAGPSGPPDAPPLENSDFYDYLGIPWTFGGDDVRTPDLARYGAVDCSGFVRLVFGYRSGYPLLGTNGPGPGLPRRAWAMHEVGPGIAVLPDMGAPPSNLGALQAGDLLFFDLDRATDRRIDHVAIYLGRDGAGHHRFVSSRARADGPTLGDAGGTSLLDGGGHYARAFRAAKRL
ncbi:NlpC/P60 family protein [Pseudonocardia xinjiangensis]|uniref:NlpC/P60 family protein n=1 Tax=Pseudonocardia xinjiangensis TaxID=75289 RepID=UPI003D8B5EDB